MIIEDFRGFSGQHCETTATGALLSHAGLPLSEPMVFGLGQGLGYGVFVFKAAPAPFIAGRSKPEAVTTTLAANLGLQLDLRQTRSAKKAWSNVATFVDAGQPVAVKVDMHFLDYFDLDQHFAGHYVTVYGYDDDVVHVVDTQDRMTTTGRHSFEEGRRWRGPMASNALTWTIAAVPVAVDWPPVFERAIGETARAYLSPPIANFGASGIRKTAKLVVTWLDTIDDPSTQLPHLAMLMESGGTGGGLFRSMYAAFLDEAHTTLGDPVVEEAAGLYRQASRLWTDVSEHLAAAPNDGVSRLTEAAEVLNAVAEIEHQAASVLSCRFSSA